MSTTAPAEWIAAYEAIGGSVAVHRINGALFLASSQPRKTRGYELDEELSASPASLAAVCAHLAETRPVLLVESQPLRPSAWLREFRAAGGKATAYVYADDATDPADPFPVLSLVHLPGGPAATLAGVLTPDQRDMAAEHIAQIEGAFTALGRRS